MIEKKLIFKDFVFVRHGETEYNKQGILMGNKDIPLNNTGLAQAKNIYKLLQNLPITNIVTSNLTRAKQTAEIIAKDLSISSIKINNNIRERCLGEFEGVSKGSDILCKFSEDRAANFKVEIYSDFKNRVIKAVDNILHISGLPLIVSHGGVFRCLLKHLQCHEMEVLNCVPYYFRAPVNNNTPYFVYQIEK